MFGVRTKETQSVVTTDGIRLDADIYRPEGVGPFPVLLMRQPYGRAIASTIVYAHPRWYAAHGYIVVIQDVRGRGTSRGEFDLFAHEVADGKQTVEWAAQISGSDGQVGMYGFSYQGMTQLYAAQASPAGLRAIAPAMTGYYLYEDWAYENGAFYLQLGLTWAIQLAAETARIKGNTSQYQALLAAARDLPVSEEVAVCPRVLSNVSSFFHDWVRRSPSSPYWQALTPQLKHIDLPMLHIGGWFDPYLRGDVRLYEEMAARSEHPHHFWVGPWRHIPWSRKVGELDFGSAAISPIDRLQIEWFDHILKGKPLEREPDSEIKDTESAKAAISAQQPVCLFEMGTNRWKRFSVWPPISTERTYWFYSNGLANIREDDGQLLNSLVKTNLAKTNTEQNFHTDSLVLDPWNPTPSLGGHAAIPAGAFERTHIDSRGDVLTYTSAPLEAAMRVAGNIRVTCAIASSHPSYDLCAIFSKVTIAGKVYNLTQGYKRCESSKNSTTVPLHPTCFCLSAGEKFRISLSAACFPAYALNPGTGQPLYESRTIDAEIITLTVTTGQDSYITLPVVHT